MAVDGWDGVADGGRQGFAASGEVVLVLTEYEWGIGRGRGRGELREIHVSVWDALVFGFFFNRWDMLV